MTTPLLRSWDVGGARPVPRRAGAVIDLAQLALRPLLRLLTRPTWIGAENLPATGAALACGNHLGPVDAFAYGHLLQASGIAPRFLAKEAMFRVPVLGAALRSARQIPVRRAASRGRHALEDARQALGRGELLMIFPEGTYTRDPDLWPMQARPGAARLALETGAPLVPIASWGGRKLWPVGSPVPHPGPGRRLVIRVGEPYTVARQEGETSQEAALRVSADLMARIADLLGRTRGERPPAALHDPRGDEHRPEIGRPQAGFRPVRQR
ncbi:acyl-phosphate glycerol 3-phosphate acyltransferase [Brachybacterium sp. P6-10-X1]|uniref:lysophospholipid acyltransferase family protein n=1 Tax=Brachybacterium sp. P6-10-X1 TaxID=1903186 RepID=UPI0009717ADE|nr:lysophospholipid acyltransferase family protein [Brachybacterium sp. P6-10-X1]APX32225.1 acyl-phosphate glycerol 3-phosphate acyltransferase [Brachybacterium sp. P6-10-X1]